MTADYFLCDEDGDAISPGVFHEICLESQEFERQMSSYAEHLSQQGQTVTQQLLSDVDHFSILEHYLNDGCFVEWIKEFHASVKI